jgi:serine/threonine-protein kinase
MLVGQTIGSGDYRFEIEAELGSGAMGMVYRARFYMDGKVIPVALKMVSLGLVGNESAMARFEREAKILKQLRHPNIVRLYASGQYRKMPFIAMEYVDGESLDRILSRRGRLSWEEVISYGKQLCAALQHAHDKGIIHRDLKPSNIMLTHDGILKLTDFGIAKDIDVTALTAANSTIGTAAYMSPEQCRGDRHLTHKSDLYSLGVVFFELLTGRKPFRAETTMDMFLKHVQEEPPRPSRLTVEVPPKLEALILQLMSKNKDDRPTDAAWVGRMLEEIEQDALDLRSAGEALLHSRNLDRPRHADGSRLTQEDREALRVLRGKKRRKKISIQTPWWERPIVRAVGLTTLLLILIVGAFWAMRPPSAQQLHDIVVASNNDPDKRLEAARNYLKRYGQHDDERTRTVATIFRELVVRERDRVLHNRLARNLSQPLENDDAEAYQMAWKALEYEKLGNLALAENQWKQLLDRFREPADLPFALDESTLASARWGWLARFHIELLQKVKDETARLRKLLEQIREFEQPFPAEQSPEALALKGLWLETFGDRPKALRYWNQLHDSTEKQSEHRIWYLLATERKQRTPGSLTIDPVKLQLELITKHLHKAQQLALALQPDDPAFKRKQADIRILCRDIVELYADEQELAIQQLVNQAKELFQKHSENKTQ